MRAWMRVGLVLLVAGMVGSWGEAQTVHFSGAQTAVTHTLAQPVRVAVDAKGDVFVTDVWTAGVFEEVPEGAGYRQVKIPTSPLLRPYGITVDPSGTVIVADSGHNRILREVPTAGGGYQESVLATSALNSPNCVFADAAGNVFVCDMNDGRVLRETPTGSGGYVETVVDNKMWSPTAVAEDAAGNLYVADVNAGVVYKETFANNAYTQSRVPTGGLWHPTGVVVDGAGNLYVGDVGMVQVVKEVLSGGKYTPSVVASSNLSRPDGIALDGAGNLFIIDTWNGRVLRQHLPGAEFGPVAVQASGNLPAPVQSLVFTFDTAGTLAAAPVVSRQGMQTTDFTAVKTSTCVAGQAYAAGASCLVDVAFAPTTVGGVSGAAVLENSAGSMLATGYAHGTGVGPLVSFAPAVETVVGSGLRNPRAVAADAAGNVYIADTDNQRIVKETLAGGSYTQSVVSTSALQWPLGVAVDGNGNVYVSDTYHSRQLKESLEPNGSTAPVESVIVATGLNYPAGIAVDGAGTFYLADSENNRILTETPSATGYVANTLPISGLSNVYGVTVDGAGNLYIADSGNNRVLKEAPASAGGGTYTQTLIPTSTLAFPRSVAVDANGDLFIADTNNGRVVEEAWNGNGYTEAVIRSGLGSPDSVALDGSGNLYITDTANQQVLKETFAAPPSLQFASTAVGSTSAAQQVTVGNVGNAPLSFPAPSSGGNPAVSVGFSLNAGVADACPSTSAGHDPGADLGAGASCVLSISFAPTIPGSQQGYLVLGDTSAGAAGALQSVAMAGMGTADTVKLQLNAPATATYGNAVQVTALLTNSSNQDAVGAGSVGFSDQASVFGTQTVAGGQATQSYLAASVGTAALKAVYTPSDSTMDSAQAQASMQVLPAPLSASAADASRVYGAANPVFTGNVTGAVNGDTFSETFSSAAKAVSAVGTYPIVPAVTGKALSNYTVTNRNGTLTITAAQLTAKANDVTRAYGAANPVFTGGLTGAVNGDQLTETYTTTATAASAPGTYAIVPAVSGPAAGNYTPVLQNGTLTITAAQLTAKANDVTRAYGAANPVFTGGLTGAVNGDQLTETYTTTATAASAPGTYAIVPAVSGPAAGNYTPVLQNGTLTITAAQLTAKANDVTRAYGSANPVFTGGLTGAVNGDVLTETYTTTATASSAPGTYAIVPVAEGPSLGNYSVVATNGTLTIAAAALTLSAQDQTRVYGQANPTFTGSVTGAAAQDSFTESFATTATAGSPVGSYAIVPTATGPTLGDYTVSTRPGTLTVKQAVLQVTANSVSRSYGAPNPPFTGQMQGAVAGDAVQVAYTAQADALTPPGSYPIGATLSGSAAGNYAMSVTDGVLTIAALPTVTTLTRATGSASGPQTLQAAVTVGGSGMPSGLASPSGTVRFYAGSTLLAEVPLVQGPASWTGLVPNPTEARTLTAVYSGDVDWQPSASSAVMLAPDTTGFWIKPLGPSPQAMVQTGQTATYPMQAGPGASGLYPGVVSFSVQGLPEGATASFSPAQVNATEGVKNVTMTVTIPKAQTTAYTQKGRKGGWEPGDALPALLLLPLVWSRKLRRTVAGMRVMCLLVGASVALIGLTGCGVTLGPGMSTVKQVSYTLTVVMTTGGQQVKMEETLMVQQ